VRISGTVLSDA